ncbi:MAG TPA: TonB C-terminal domain-containing protein [Blastocatellia bacterium]|nr:TonB C-terminal domain-containing protein [Blastocatellia bacterium]
MRAEHKPQAAPSSLIGSPRLGILLSIALHAAILGGLFFWAHRVITTEIVAAGPGEGGEGGGGSIEVGVADKNAILGFAKPQTVSFVGDKDEAINNAKVETARKENENSEALLPPTERDAPDPKSVKTDRPVVNQQEKIFTGKEERGRSDAQTVQQGHSYGSPTPTFIGGVGIGSGGGFGGGTGLPGGSEYGRRIQMIFSRNFNPAQADSDGVQTVIMALRISRDGKIISVINGRVTPADIRQRSGSAQVNFAAERAVVASDPLPPFPTGFLPGVQDVRVNFVFRYPK